MLTTDRDEPDYEPAEAVVYCPACAAREFGSGAARVREARVRRIAWRVAPVILLLIALGIAVNAGHTLTAAIVAVLSLISLALLVLELVAWASTRR
jgi:pyridoxine 5'-phosphate synthase PdxJ